MKNETRKLIKEWDDTHIPRGRVGHHATGIPKKYWIAIGDDIYINNYSEFVNQSLLLKPIANNATPSFTTIDVNKAKELAKRTVLKFPGKYVFFGVDNTSRGMMTGKNHLRASIMYYYDPTIKVWSNNVMYRESEVNEAYIKPFLHDVEENGDIITVRQLKDILNKNFKDTDILDFCSIDGEPGYKIKAIWNSNMEYEMTGDDDGRDNVCYIRISE